MSTYEIISGRLTKTYPTSLFHLLAQDLRLENVYGGSEVKERESTRGSWNDLK